MTPTPVILLSLLGGCTKTTPPPVDPAAATLQIEQIPRNDAAHRWFDRRIGIFGVEVVAAPDTPDAKLRHAAAVIAEYLDNDENGEADDLDIPRSLSKERATLVMFATADDLDRSSVFESSWVDGRIGQDLAADETAPAGEFDASLEEVLHLIHNGGHALVYPADFDMGASTLTEAMDLARGGHFTQIPSSYPSEAWYHYDDRSCRYRCMATEYAYWLQTALLGAQSGRCEDIAVEWELCTPAQVRQGDPAGTKLLEETVKAPITRLPDGTY